MSDVSDLNPDPGGPQSSIASTDKPHPSEFLEFVTVASGPTGQRLQPLRTQTAKDSSEEGLNVTRSNDDLFHGLSAAIPSLRRLSVEARAATKAEHAMTFLRGCRLYPKAIAWSFLLSMTIVMEGYDLTLINSFFAFPVFRRSYGEPANPGAPTGQKDYQISPAWQSGLTNAAVTGEIIGLLFVSSLVPFQTMPEPRLLLLLSTQVC
jgi:hypothetical protein